MIYKLTYQWLQFNVKCEVTYIKLLKLFVLTNLSPLTPYRGGIGTDNLYPTTQY